MQLAGAEAFDRLAAHAARRPFKYGSREYAPGEPFDTGALSEREARILYVHRFIVRAQARDEAPAALAPAAAASPVPGAVGAPAASAAALAAASKPSLKHLGGGWYDVVAADGTALNDRRLRKHEAEEMLK